MGGGFWNASTVSTRSRIVLAAAAGQSDSAIARELEVNRNTVMLWRTRFQQEGLDGLWEVAPGRAVLSWLWLKTHPQRLESTLNPMDSVASLPMASQTLR